MYARTIETGYFVLRNVPKLSHFWIYETNNQKTTLLNFFLLTYMRMYTTYAYIIIIT